MAAIPLLPGRKPMSTRTLTTTLALALLLPLPALAHGPVPRTAEGSPVEARLFIADSSNGQVVVVDLPDGKVIARLGTPPHILSFGLGGDERHIYAMRGRNTDRDTITVIDTGMDRDSGLASFPTIVRTFTGRAPGGVRNGYVASLGGRDTILNEEIGEILVLGDGLAPVGFGSLDAVSTRSIQTSAPDHYHYLEAAGKLYVGHLAKGYVQVLDSVTGSEVTRIGPCPVLHGMAADETSGRLFFACMQDVIVIGTRGDETDQLLARIPYPDRQRAAVFIEGRGRVLWGSTEGANPAILRLDAGREPYRFQSIPVNAAIQRDATRDGRYVLLYTRDGQLEIRNGRSGRLQRTVTLSAPFDSEYHEHVDKALLPDIRTLGRVAYVTIPPEGVIVEVDIRRGRVLRRIEVGGEPTRLLIVSGSGND
jgi:hypothetical protein